MTTANMSLTNAKTILQLVQNDAHASTFQTLAQYRAWLANIIKHAIDEAEHHQHNIEALSRVHAEMATPSYILLTPYGSLFVSPDINDIKNSLQVLEDATAA